MANSDHFSILTNEKYKGDALLQKAFCADFLIKKMKINEGKVAQYHAGDRSHRGTSCFAGKTVCGCCGGLYGSKIWHSADKYRRVIWQCNSKFKGKAKCNTRT